MARVKIGLNLLPVNSAALTLAAAGTKRGRLTLVPDHFVPRKAVVRTPGDCRETLDRLLQSGFTQISLTPMGDVTKCLRTLGDKVLPRPDRA